jgi:4-hydroxy-L-threonine phosphate dehydrogenase PdxA
VIIGDERVLRQGEQIAKCRLNYKKVETLEEIEKDKQHIYLLDLKNLDPQEYSLGELSIQSGMKTGETLEQVLSWAGSHNLDGVVYAPLNKEALKRGGYSFKDELHFFAHLLDVQSGFGEINVMDDLWFTRVTSHIPIREVNEHITKENVLRVIEYANTSLERAGVHNPKIAVAALNPHAGDGGTIGHEEIDEIIPAVQKAVEKGINAVGPYPADTIFLRLDKEKFNAIVSMYHDQGQTGMKLLGFNRGVTVSGGLHTEPHLILREQEQPTSEL